MKNSLAEQITKTIQSISTDLKLRQYVNTDLPIPEAYGQRDQAKLIFLGQDPTIKNLTKLKDIKMVLNLNKPGPLYAYLNMICKGLGLDLKKDVYATNFLKNFFIKPPTQFKDNALFTSFAHVWFPLLHEELGILNNVPVITLGQPVLSLIVQGDTPKLVREYWGYNKEWKTGKTLTFKYIEPDKNILNKKVFPFPHQPSRTKRFYNSREKLYIDFVRENL